MAIGRVHPLSLVVAALAPSLVAQTWQLAPTLTSGPPATWRHATAYDLFSDTLVMFGGVAGLGASGDTWTWRDGAWTQIAAVAAPPQAIGAAMAYDPVNQGVLLFGGAASQSGGPVFAQTWLFANGAWTQLSPPLSPPARSNHAMVTDLIRGRILLFGGQANNIWPSQYQLQDTWLWNGNTWQQLTIPSPPPRQHHALAFDIVRDRVVLFGGFGGLPGAAGALADTWEFDGSNWQQLTPAAAPSLRFTHRMTYDVARGVVALHGGALTTGIAETWDWNGVDWQAASSPSPEILLHSLDYAPPLGRILSVGGYEAANPTMFARIWTHGSTVPATASPFGIPCPNSNGSRVLVGQPPWIGASLALDVTPTPALAAYVLGVSNTSSPLGPLPQPLTSFGLQGCQLFVRPDAILFANAPNQALVAPLPFRPSLAGTVLYAQGLALVPGANLLGLLTTNAVAMTIGWQ